MFFLLARMGSRADEREGERPRMRLLVLRKEEILGKKKRKKKKSCAIETKESMSGFNTGHCTHFYTWSQNIDVNKGRFFYHALKKV